MEPKQRLVFKVPGKILKETLTKIPSIILLNYKYTGKGFPGGTVVKNPPANAGDTGSIRGPGRSHIPQSN